MATYRMDVALSVASGKLLCEDFGDMHALITDLAGWPVMTHHMANDKLMDGAARKVIAQVPWMPSAIENMPTFDTVDPATAEAQVRAYIGRLTSVYGETVDLELGEELPMLGLLAGLEHLGGAR